jgi:hypothetical protein
MHDSTRLSLCHCLIFCLFAFVIMILSNRVPLGFICGYPVGNGGELYGGSMFIKSAASDTLQGKATQAINERWGEGKWNGRETIGIAVCKKKYAPFNFSVKNGSDGKLVQVERMFGCRCHSEIRKSMIESHGVRKGWEPFGQWSMQKAQDLARRGTERMNGGNYVESKISKMKISVKVGGEVCLLKPPYTEVSSSDEELKSMCNNGKCTWKMRAKYDNIYREVTGTESSDEE